MTPASLAHAVAAAEVAIAPAPVTPSEAALELLERLVIESHRATAAAQRGDGDSLHQLLDVRGEMIGALEALGKIVAPRIGPFRLQGRNSEAARTALLAKTSELQELNVRLMQCVRAEAVRLSVAIVAAEQGEPQESAYRAPQAERATNLDLMR